MIARAQDGADDRAGSRVAIQILDKFSIQLDTAYWITPDRFERGIAGSEVIDPDGKACSSQRLEIGQCLVFLPGDGGLGDLEMQAMWLDPFLLKDGADPRGQMGLAKLDR